MFVNLDVRKTNELLKQLLRYKIQLLENVSRSYNL